MAATNGHGPAGGVVVVGGGSGIGQASALQVAATGRPLSIWDKSAGGAAETARLCREAGVAAHPVAVDVTDPAAIEAAAAESRRALPSISGLVHSAGVLRLSSPDRVDLREFSTMMDVNVRSFPLCVAALLDDLKAGGPGSAIVAISSIEAFTTTPGMGLYASTKASVMAMVRGYTGELGPFGIRVVAVCPGPVWTPMMSGTEPYAAMRESLAQRTPLRRIAVAEDVARVVKFALSEDAGMVSGAALVVDGGVTAIA